MKYYIYISDAKVDMLLPQVPHELKKKVATEFKIDLKLLSASRKTESETEINRIARLETVCNYIHEFGNVGSVDEPDEYIEDTLTMKWLTITLGKYVYFTACTDKTIFGLGGSSWHLVGHPKTEDMAVTGMHSLAYPLVDALRATVGDASGDILEPKYGYVSMIH